MQTGKPLSSEGDLSPPTLNLGHGQDGREKYGEGGRDVPTRENVGDGSTLEWRPETPTRGYEAAAFVLAAARV